MKMHLPHFLVLVCILALSIATLYLFSGNRPWQLVTIISTAVVYVLWGIIHHAQEKDLHFRVVVEYILMAAIAVMLALTLMI